MAEMKEGVPDSHTIALLVKDQPGTLFLVSSIFSNRGISMTGIDIQEAPAAVNGAPCLRLNIRFTGEPRRQEIIRRLLLRLECVLECT